MGTVVYLTGAPATGKSTLCRALSETVNGLQVFCYSEKLRDHVNARRERQIDEVEIRERSAAVVTREDVEHVDTQLINWVATERRVRDVVIDSHPVTAEVYGFRITAFSQQQLAALAPDVIICLYADPAILQHRIAQDAQGRRSLTHTDISLHVTLQASVAAQYAVLLGKACHLVNSDTPRADLVETVIARAELHRKAGH
jgi:adenylate kinase